MAMPVKLSENWKNEQKPGGPESQTPGQEISPRNAAPPPPPPRPITSRRASFASDVSVGSWNKSNHSYSSSLLGPAIVGPSISVDDWAPELPPKKPHLRTIPPPLPRRSPSPIQVPPSDADIELSLQFHKSLLGYDRMPTPELPLPPPPVVEDEGVPSDEPLPPPPPEVEWHLATAVPRRSTPMSSGRTSPQSPIPFSPTKNLDLENTSVEQNESIRGLLIPDAYEIQYDQAAINAIMESNRMAELQKKKYSSKAKHGGSKDGDDKQPMKVHIENRPPLPLPRDVQINNDRKQDGCDRGTWHKTKETQPEVKASFVRSFSKPENASRGSMRVQKNEANIRSSLRFPPKKMGGNGKIKDRLSPDVAFTPGSRSSPKKSPVDYNKPFTVKKVSEYECRIPNRERDGLTVFETTTLDDSLQQQQLQHQHNGHLTKG